MGHQSLPRFDGDFYTIEKSTADRIAPPRNRMPDSMGTKNKILPRTDHAPNFSKIREKKRPSVVIKSHYNNTIELNQDKIRKSTDKRPKGGAAFGTIQGRKDSINSIYNINEGYNLQVNDTHNTFFDSHSMKSLFSNIPRDFSTEMTSMVEESIIKNTDSIPRAS